MQSQPGISAADTSALMRFASSELLKIETAWPEGQTEARARALSSELAADGGGERDRTDDLLLAKQALSQLSYTPDENRWWVWLDSNQRPPPYQDGALTD
jgi:hypothetical protein